MWHKKRPSWFPVGLWLRYMRQRDRRKYFHRLLSRFFRNPKLALAYSNYHKAVRRADWPLVREYTLKLADLARETNDRRLMIEMVHALGSFGFYEESGKLWLRELAFDSKKKPKQWLGENLTGKTIIVNLNQAAGGGLGVGYRCSPFLRKIAALAGKATFVLEPRQLKTFRRSFPDLEFTDTMDGLNGSSADFIILPANLLAVTGTGLAAPEFQPLIADKAKTKELREKYLATQSTPKPLIGICWYSGHHGKDLPPLQQWHDFIARTDATFVSLQYGNVTSDVKIFGADRIIADQEINQLVDMDTFAAQVSSLDGVITIMNTLVHVGGSLGVPTVVLRDDWFRRPLPVLSDRLPWFPNNRVAGKDLREWPSVFDEAFAKLQEMWREKRSS